MTTQEKIKWKNHDFYYTYEPNEPIFSENYFQFFNGNAKSVTTEIIQTKIETSIKVLSDKELMVSGPFYEGYYVVINGERFYYSEVQNPSAPIVKPTPLAPPLPQNEYLIEENEYGSLYMNKLPEDYPKDFLEVKFKMEEYTNEVYPDYPFRTSYKTVQLNKFCSTEILKPQKNVIYVISLTVNGQKFSKEYRAPLLCYFSNVADLRTFMKDLKLELPDRSDDDLKKLIQEKSVQLKRRFGLLQNYIEDPEYFPIYKKVVNLYCVDHLISVSFINGNFISSGFGGSGNGLTLSKFKVNDEGGNSNPILSTELVKDMIRTAEADLYSSLFKKPINIEEGKKNLCCPQTSTR